jgi:hypothetical protein
MAVSDEAEKTWIKSQEAIFRAHERLESLGEKSHPACQAEYESNLKRIEQLEQQISEIERSITGDHLEKLRAELEELKAERRREN